MKYGDSHTFLLLFLKFLAAVGAKKIDPQYKSPLTVHLAKTINTDSSCTIKIIKQTEYIYYCYSPLSQKISLIYIEHLSSCREHLSQTIHCGTTAAAISIRTALPF